jgi:carbonic anhydrase
MRAQPPALPRRPAAAPALLALILLAGAARASEHGPTPAKPATNARPGPDTVATAALPPASAASSSIGDRSPRAAEARGPRDPMELLRERLAKKLGAGKVAEGPSPNVVRVVSTPSAPVAAAQPPVRAPQQALHDKPLAHVRGPVPRAADHAATHAAHWDYIGSGAPDTWGRMKPEFAKCATGTRQSPIDIREGLRVDLEPVQFAYRPSGFRVVDNGHTVQVNLAAGNSIEVMGRRYELVQFHFHRPSEERIDGRQFDMVVHLVHKDIDGRLAVVAVLLDRGPAQPIVQAVWNNLPLEQGDEVVARGLLDATELLPAQRSYFTYMGSLTTPPCSEGVLWMVMKQPQPISAEQIGIFARLYPMNARPIQPASGRMIKESN